MFNSGWDLVKGPTMEAAPRTARIEPTVGATTAHLTIDDDAARPRAVAFVAIFAGNPRGLASNVGEQGLNVAPARQVESLLGPALVGEALAGLACQPLGKSALDVEVAVPGVPREVLGGLDHGRVHHRVAGLHLMRGPHLGGRLVLVSVRVLVDMLGLCQALLHLLQLLLNGPRGDGPAVGEDAGGCEVDMGRQAGWVAGAVVVVVHVGLGLGLAMGVLGEVRVHGGSRGSRGGIIVGAHPHVVKDGAGIHALQMVLQVVAVCVAV